MPAAGWMHRLLHLLFGVAKHGLLALAISMADLIVLVVLAIVLPSRSVTSSKGATNLRRSRERVPS
jgi:hypothetical protein